MSTLPAGFTPRNTPRTQATALAMIEAGATLAEVCEETGLTRGFVSRLRTLGPAALKGVTPAMLEKARAAELEKLDAAKHMLLDELLENPALFEKSNVSQVASAYAALNTQSQLLRGQPTNILLNLTDDELTAKKREVERRIAAAEDVTDVTEPAVATSDDDARS